MECIDVHPPLNQFEFHLACTLDEWTEMRGRYWMLWAENQRLKKRNELLEKALADVNALVQEMILKKDK